MAAADAAVGVVPSADVDLQSSAWFYELLPPQELPVLNLSLSLKSRFLSRRAMNRVDRLIRHRKLLGATAWIANAGYLVMLLTPRSIGCVTAVLAFACWIPISISGASSLRYDMILRLMRTHDFWFLSCVNVSVFTVFGVLLGDTRAVAMLATWVGVQMNVMVDANIRKVRSWLFLNVLAISVYIVTWVAVSFCLVDDLKEFRLMHYRHHELPASAFVANGLLTIIATFARNIYRRRDIFWKTSPNTRIECVSYRTDLRFYPLASIPRCRSQDARPGEQGEHMKAMKHVKAIGLIDARNALLDIALLRHVTTRAAACAACFRCSLRNVVRWLGALALISTAASSLYILEQDRSRNPVVLAAHVVGFTLTLAYCGMCALHYHRILLLALVTSFDFLFLSVQVTVVHFCACVFFDWSVNSVLATVECWVWAHWLLCLDALPPVMKRKLGISKRFAVAVLFALAVACMELTYQLVFTDLGSVEMYERVVLHTKVFGDHELQIKLASVFFNFFATTMVLSSRLVWRAMTLHSDTLLVLDGAVVYENYMVGAKVRASRRFGSLSQVTQQPSSASTTRDDSPTSQDLLPASQESPPIAH